MLLQKFSGSVVLIFQDRAGNPQKNTLGSTLPTTSLYFAAPEVGEHFGLCGIATEVPQSNTVQPARAQ
jgi:hypothetical protein